MGGLARSTALTRWLLSFPVPVPVPVCVHVYVYVNVYGFRLRLKWLRRTSRCERVRLCGQCQSGIRHGLSAALEDGEEGNQHHDGHGKTSQ